METLGPSPRVHVVWHPADVPEGTAEAPIPLPAQLFRLLHSDPSLNADERCGMTVRLHTGALQDDGSSEVPSGVEVPAVGQVLVVVLVGKSLVNDEAWIEWVRRLRIEISESDGSELLPIGLFAGSLGQAYLLGELAVERVFEQPSVAERDRGTRIAVLRTLARMLGDGRRMRVFVSHAKVDGARVAKVLAGCLDELKGEAWIDVEQIESGNSFRKVLDDALDPAITVFVAVVSNAYATREWCRWEAQMAKQRGLPMVALDMVTEGQRRSVPALGNVPVIRFNAPSGVAPDAPVTPEGLVAVRRVMEAVLLELVNGRYFARRVAHVAERFATDAAEFSYFSPAPDLMALVSRASLESKATVGVYPDPPLPKFETDLLQNVAGPLRLTTPWSLVAHLSSRQQPSDAPDARALRVALSISRPPAGELRRRALSSDHVDTLFLGVCRYLLAAGHTIAFGGAPSVDFTETLADIERTYRFADPDGDRRLINYVAHSFRPTTPPETGTSDVMKAIDVEPAPRVAGFERFDAINDLTAMRRRMAAETDVRIIAAGDLQPGKVGTRRGPGVIEEAYFALQAGEPLLIVGGLGGGGRLLVDAMLGQVDPSEIDRLRPHFPSRDELTATPDAISFDDMLAAFSPTTDLRHPLSDDESLRLAISTDVDEIASLLVLALHRIGTAGQPTPSPPN